jgi:hypothetical protein
VAHVGIPPLVENYSAKHLRNYQTKYRTCGFNNFNEELFQKFKNPKHYSKKGNFLRLEVFLPEKVLPSFISARHTEFRLPDESSDFCNFLLLRESVWHFCNPEHPVVSSAANFTADGDNSRLPTLKSALEIDRS